MNCKDFVLPGLKRKPSESFYLPTGVQEAKGGELDTGIYNSSNSKSEDKVPLVTCTDSQGRAMRT